MFVKTYVLKAEKGKKHCLTFLYFKKSKKYMCMWHIMNEIMKVFENTSTGGYHCYHCYNMDVLYFEKEQKINAYVIRYVWNNNYFWIKLKHEVSIVILLMFVLHTIITVLLVCATLGQEPRWPSDCPRKQRNIICKFCRPNCSWLQNWTMPTSQKVRWW